MRRLALVLIACPMLALSFGPQVREMMLEIASRDDALTPPTTEGLISYWSMRESDGTVFDEHGSNDGTAVKSPVFGTQYGVRDDGVFTENENAHISVPDDSSLSFTNKELTLSVWAKIPDTLVNSAMLYKGSDNFNREYMFFVYGTGAVMFRLFESGENLIYDSAVSDTEVFTADRWHHLVGIGDGSKLYVYVDGEKVAEEDTTITLGDLTSALYISTFAGSVLKFPGYMDEIRIYNRALSAAEITELYEWDKEGAGH